MPKFKVPQDILDMIPDIPGLNTTYVGIRIDQILKGNKLEIVIDGKLYSINSDKYLYVLSAIKSGVKNITISGIMFGNKFQDLGGQTFGVNSDVVRNLLENPANFEAFIGQGVWPDTKVVPYVGDTGATSGSTLNLEQGEVSTGGGQVGGPNFKDNKSKVVDVESFGAPKGQQAAGTFTSAVANAPKGQQFVGATPKAAPAAVQVPTSLTGDSVVDALIKKAFLEDKGGDLQDLTDNPFWSDADLAVRQKAFKKIQEITSSEENLANYVVENKITDLTDYTWWNDQPGDKNVTWDLIQKKSAVIPDQTGAGVVGTPGAPGIPDETGATIEAPGPGVIPPLLPDHKFTWDGTSVEFDPGAPTDTSAEFEALREKFKKELEDSVNNGLLTQDQADLFLQTWDEYPSGEPIDVNKILDKFNEIQENTLDPEFATQIEAYTTDLKASIAFQEQQREIEEETEKTLAGQQIKQAKAGLEKAGMTFTGKGIEQLGAASAFAQEGESAIPTQTPFGGLFYEGTVNQANRLLSTSSLAKYKKNLQELGRIGEDVLGTEAALGLNIPGFGAVGSVTGSLPQAQQQEKADVLSGLIEQEQKNLYQSSPFKFNL